MKKMEEIKVKPKIARKRHIAKTITWRIVGTIDTWIITYFLALFFGETSDINMHSSDNEKAFAAHLATYISGLELITKSILYYFHERIWFKLDWISTRQKIRHIIKTISWRLVGAIDTILLVFTVYYLFRDHATMPEHLGLHTWYSKASQIGLTLFSIEIITKLILYYLHERIWFKSNYGVIKLEEN